MARFATKPFGGSGSGKSPGQALPPPKKIRRIASTADAISLGWARRERLHAAIVRLNQAGGRQEMFPKISSANRCKARAIREVDLFSFETTAGVFMRGIRAPRQNLSENLRPIRCAVWTPRRGIPTMSV